YGQAIVPPSAQTGVVAIASGRDHTAAISGNVVSLQVQRSGSNVLISWPIGSYGFSLQSTPSLNPPPVWSLDNDAPSPVGPVYVVTNSTSETAKFYRLIKF